MFTGSSKVLKLKGPVGLPDLSGDISFGIIGWKQWSLETKYEFGDMKYTGRIRGGYSHPWSSNMVTRDTSYSGQTISAFNTAGIYAYEDEKNVFPDRTNPRGLPNLVWGEVLLWGTVYAYAKRPYSSAGYRAEKAYPLSLFASNREAAKALEPWLKKGVYVNVYSPDTPGSDKNGYIEYEPTAKRKVKATALARS